MIRLLGGVTVGAKMKLVRSLFWMSLYVVGLIGVVHVTYTFEIFDELSQEALYFAGTGLGVVVLVLFNYAIWRVPSPDRLARRLTHCANAIMAIYGFFAIRAVPEPQAYVGFAAFIVLVMAALVLDAAQKPPK